MDLTTLFLNRFTQNFNQKSAGHLAFLTSREINSGEIACLLTPIERQEWAIHKEWTSYLNERLRISGLSSFPQQLLLFCCNSRKIKAAAPVGGGRPNNSITGNSKLPIFSNYLDETVSDPLCWVLLYFPQRDF